MSSFVKAYSSIKGSVVAIVQKFHKEKPEFPGIIGTGFLVSTSGVVCTCRHVVDAIDNLYRPKDFKGVPACVLLIADFESHGQKGVGVFNLDILAAGAATLTGDTKKYIGPNPPEVAFILLPVTDTPAVQFATEELEEGEEVCFAGFPMGTRTLVAPGWLHQITPTLHHGLISAILPHHLEKFPHCFLLHANTQPGASGSPVFRQDGRVVGMVYMVLRHFERIGRERDGAYLQYAVPTSLTGCVPFGILTDLYKLGEAALRDVPQRPTLEEHLRSLVPVQLGTDVFTEWKGHDTN